MGIEEEKCSILSTNGETMIRIFEQSFNKKIGVLYLFNRPMGLQKRKFSYI